MKISLPLAAVLAVVLIGAFAERSVAGAPESKIAVVNVEQMLAATEDGRNAGAILKKAFDKRQQDLDAKQAELSKAQADIEKQSRVLSHEAYRRRMDDWQRRMVELQTVFVDYRQTLQKKHDDLYAPILKKTKEIIARLARKNGYEIILDRQAAPYVREDLDVTDQAIALYNSGGDTGDPGGGKKPDGQ
jgi:outer membrane protein